MEEEEEEEEEKNSSLAGFNLATISSMRSRASNYSKNGDLARAIRIGEDCLQRFNLVCGEFCPITLSCIFCLACDYASISNFGKALSLHEECLQKRREVFGDQHNETLSSVTAVTELKSKIADKKKSESPYFKMKTKDLIELIDRRKLCRSGLQEKSELAELLYNAKTPIVENRGVTLALLQAYRKLAISRNKDASFWTIAHVSALINGNHEILKADCRFGKVDPVSTLTFDDKCPLIDVLLTKHFDSNNKHPLLNISYKEAVGEQANLFISFAYQDNFIDLVDALELFLETHSKEEEYHIDTTYFWFDLPLNNQWTASDQPFEFWTKTFHDTVKAIGHTLCFMSPWDDPSILTRVWCLLEMCYSPRISIILSRKEVFSLQNMLSEDFYGISRSLCNINAEKATSFKPEDKERIFKVIQCMKGGVHSFNVKVMELIRDWIASSARKLLEQSCDGGGGGARIATDSSGLGVCSSSRSINSCSSSDDINLTWDQLANIDRAGLVLYEHGKLEEAKELFERALSGQEKHPSIGPNHKDALKSVANLALIHRDQGQLEEAQRLLERALSGFEKLQEPNPFDYDQSDTLHVVNNLAHLFSIQDRFDEARKLIERALSGREKLLGPRHADTLVTVHNFGFLLFRQNKFEEAKKLYERALSGREAHPLLGPNHEDTLAVVFDLANLLLRQEKFEDAEKLFVRVLSGRERILGQNHVETLETIFNLGAVYMKLGRYEESRMFSERALTGRDALLGPNHYDTLVSVLNVGTALVHLGKFQEAKRLFKRANAGFEMLHGSDYKYTKMAALYLSNLNSYV